MEEDLDTVRANAPAYAFPEEVLFALAVDPTSSLAHQGCVFAPCQAGSDEEEEPLAGALEEGTTSDSPQPKPSSPVRSKQASPGRRKKLGVEQSPDDDNTGAPDSSDEEEPLRPGEKASSMPRKAKPSGLAALNTKRVGAKLPAPPAHLSPRRKRGDAKESNEGGQVLKLARQPTHSLIYIYITLSPLTLFDCYWV